MDLGLTGKRALVLASSRGLGFAAAEALALDGARVIVSSRDMGRAKEAAARIKGQGAREVYGFAADVSRGAELTGLFESAAATLGGLDIVVANAGGPPHGGFADIEEAQWARAFQLTLMSVVRSARLAVPHFRDAGGGTFAVITSSSAKVPIPNLVLSNTFRPAVHGLCKSLATELGADGIRVVCLAPGRHATERIAELDQSTAAAEGLDINAVRARSVGRIPLGRLGSPADFGRVAAFVCSPAASYMTGSPVWVDGGAIPAL